MWLHLPNPDWILNPTAELVFPLPIAMSLTPNSSKNGLIWLNEEADFGGLIQK